MLLFACCSATARADGTPYGWTRRSPDGDTLAKRFPPPPGAARVAKVTGFGAWLRDLPLRPPGTPVTLFDGRTKPRQDVHAAVVDLDVGRRDLQQCADAVMRLRTEYLWSKREAIAFHPDPGKPRALAFSGGTRAQLDRYLVRLFSEAGSASLQAELHKVSGPVEPGDVLIQGGYPGHAVLVLDVAVGAAGERYLLVGQSYMPAQDFHVVVNPGAAALSPWYPEADLDGAGLRTPEWRPFRRGDVRRF